MTFRPCRAEATAKLATTFVFPTPPFPELTAMTWTCDRIDGVGFIAARNPLAGSSRRGPATSDLMADVNRYPTLSREEETELARRFKAGDEDAREKLIVSNLRFVVRVAYKFRTYTMSGKYSLLDLIQEGNDGLMRAVKKFDPERGYRLITYAVWWKIGRAHV